MREENDIIYASSPVMGEFWIDKEWNVRGTTDLAVAHGTRAVLSTRVTGQYDPDPIQTMVDSLNGLYEVDRSPLAPDVAGDNTVY